MKQWFRKFAEAIAAGLGSPWTFGTAIALVIAWIATGSMFHYSTTWQMVMNTSTSVVTVLMLCLLQATQMRDTKALHLKLDELLRAGRQARTGLVGLEKLPDARLQQLSDEFTEIGEHERTPEGEPPPVHSDRTATGDQVPDE